MFFLFYSMQISIKNLDDKTILLDVELNDTIAKIKEIISGKSDVPKNIYYLSYRGKILEDTKTISDYGITRESNLQMHIPLKVLCVINILFIFETKNKLCFYKHE